MFQLDKKIVVSLLLAIVVIGGSVYFRFIKGKNVFGLKEQTPGGLVSENGVASAEDFLQNDADNDGLKYWEEALWGTEPDKADTDGDGTTDGEEVKEGRSPTLAGPNDKLQTPAIPDGVDASGINGTSTDKSLTATIARNLYANYAVLGQAGDLTPENQAKIATDLSASVSQILEPKTYTTSDIKIAQDETPVSIKQYGNEVAYVLGTTLTQGNTNEAVSLSNYLNKGDPAELQKIAETNKNYKKAVSELLVISIPKSAVQNHLLLLNSVNYFGRAIEGMAMVDDDPLVALVSLQSYQSGADKIMDSLKKLVSYFKDSKISFTSKDYGYIFSRGI